MSQTVRLAKKLRSEVYLQDGEQIAKSVAVPYAVGFGEPCAWDGYLPQEHVLDERDKKILGRCKAGFGSFRKLAHYDDGLHIVKGRKKGGRNNDDI